ncbi:MAG: SO_0444 family Cu/Zn efflux transporter [Candidatus Eisenbacteria bacterium]
MYFLIDFIRETIGFFYRVAPYLLFGFFLAGLLRVLVPARWLASMFGRPNLKSVLLASIAGVPLPLCSCSVLPTAVAMRRSGASKGATVSFLISTPETGVDSISITYALLGPLMAVLRPLVAFVTAAAAGIAVNRLETRTERGPRGDGTDEAAAIDAPACATPEACAGAVLSGHAADGATPGAPGRPRGSQLIREIAKVSYTDLLDDIGPYLLIGILLSGLLSALLPAGALAVPALQGLPSMLIMLAVSIPLYVCATGSTPIAAALILKGLNPGAALVFLLAGPATNIAAMTVLLKLLGRRALLAYLLSIAIFSLLAGFLVNSLYAASGIDAAASVGRADFIPRWIEALSALVLIALMVRSLARVRFLATSRERLRRISRPLGVDLGGRTGLALVAGLLIILYLLTGCSTVKPGEVGWVMEFGRIARTIERPGLVLHAPYPFQILRKEQPLRVRSIDRGFREGETPGSVFDTTSTGVPEAVLAKEAEIATGEETLLSIRYSVQYRIADAYAYRFGMLDPDELVAVFSEYAMRRVMAEQQTDSILVNHRPRLESRVAEELRENLGGIRSGVEVVRVDFVDVHAPGQVHFAFRDVASAIEDYERFIRQAESYSNLTVAAARGRSYSSIAKAYGDKEQQIARSAGDASHFTALEGATRRSREVTRLRMYLETASRVLAAPRLVLALVDVPLDLWLRQKTAVPWSEPPQIGGAGSGEAKRAPAAPAETGEEETWRDKLDRLEERTR